MGVLMNSVFRRRHYDSDFLTQISVCSHAIPKDTDVLCERLFALWKSQQLIVIYTDFDCDGICAGVTAFSGLSELGFKCALFLPDTSSGYGFRPADVDAILRQYPDCQAILTGDVGISSYDAVSYGKAKGLTMLVTDHHLPSKGVHLADVLVDPQRSDDKDSYGMICGANVMYQVLRYYAMRYAKDSDFACVQIDRLRFFAGLGTISDGMPVYYENRRMISDMIRLSRILYNHEDVRLVRQIKGSPVYRRTMLGIHLLLCVFHEQEKFRHTADIDETFFGFYVVPMLNSLKRMNGNVRLAYDIFFGGEEAAVAAIHDLLALTEERKALVSSAFEAMTQAVQPYAPYIYVTDAPGGVCGLLAQKMMGVTGLPCFVVHEDGEDYSGSGRCPSWFPFLTAYPTSEYWWAAGHDAAFGCGMSGELGLDLLFQMLSEEVPKKRPETEVYEPDYIVSTFGDCDSEFDLFAFSTFLYECDGVKPFGVGFPSPEGLFRLRKSEATWTLMGEKKNHIRATMPSGIVIVCFFQGDGFHSSKDLSERLPDVVEIKGHLAWNEFRDVTSIQVVGSILNLSDCLSESEVLFDAAV